MFLFSPLSFVSAALLKKEKGDKQKTPRAFEAGLSTKDLLNQFTTRNRTRVLLRNVSQRSTEKGSLEAEAGDVSILKMEIENSSKACARQLLQGSAVPLSSTAISAQAVQRGSAPFLQAWKSDFPAPLPRDSHPFCQHQAYRAVAASREQAALRRTELSICQHHLQIPQTEQTEAASSPIESKEQGCQRESDDISWTSLGSVPRGAQCTHLAFQIQKHDFAHVPWDDQAFWKAHVPTNLMKDWCIYKKKAFL